MPTLTEVPYRVHTSDWHVQVVRDVHGGTDRGQPIPAHHIWWSRQVPDDHPQRSAVIAVAEGLAALFNEHLPQGLQP